MLANGWVDDCGPQRLRQNTCRLLHSAQLLVQCMSIPLRHTHTLLRKLCYTPLPFLTKTNGAEVYVAKVHSLRVCVLEGDYSLKIRLYYGTTMASESNTMVL